MRTDQLRRLFLDYFVERDHKLLPSSSLVPKDPTLLFTSAGMVQFKDFFWGRAEPSFRKATTCQKCFRTTDIENVGKTAFHHTFFEMLGNFSFGDYFKEGAIELAWEFVTQELSIPKERLWVSVYEEDDEAYAIWKDTIGIPPARIVRLGKEHNWWGPVGASGPCGPDSEIFYDWGRERACGPDCAGVACSCNRFSEIWNLVFMQHEAHEDGSLVPLRKKNIDTGMGLERTTAVLQGVSTDFEIDLFRSIIEAIEQAAPQPIGLDGRLHRNVIADHIRGSVMLISDGVFPANEKQGYVLRRILRRAVRAGEKLELPERTLVSLIEPVVASLGEAYPETVAARPMAEKIIAREEETFRKTLRSGEQRLHAALEGLGRRKTLPGETAFELYDTYGFPLEMTEEIAAEAGVTVDRTGFEKAMTRQREMSAASASISVRTELTATATVIKAWRVPTRFLGYDRTVGEGTVVQWVPDGPPPRIVVDQSPFYAESGGQISDLGTIENLDQRGEADVLSVSRNPHGAFVHQVKVTAGDFREGDRVRLSVDADRRVRIARNHTATHLLHAALRQVAGEHVIQAGSYVTDEELRFDFSHFEALTPEEIRRVEDLANQAILADLSVETKEVTLEAAKAAGALAHFEEEYRGKELVRVVSVGSVSRELCGGTHVACSGEIGLVKVVAEESVASGTRRIRAVTGEGLLARLRREESLLGALEAELGDDPVVGLARLRGELHVARRELERLTEEALLRRRDELVRGAEKVGEATLVAVRVDLAPEALKRLADLVEEEARPAVVLLVGEAGGRGIVVAKISKGQSSVDAGALVRTMAASLGGNGGGNRSFAQGGGPNVLALGTALEAGLVSAKKSLG